VVGTQCTEWECGWLGKVPHVWNEFVDSLERYLMYGMRLWMVQKGAWSMVWLMHFSTLGS
jgi:hypothetical protein